MGYMVQSQPQYQPQPHPQNNRLRKSVLNECFEKVGLHYKGPIFSAYGANACGHGVANASSGGDRPAFAGPCPYTAVRVPAGSKSAGRLPTDAYCANVRDASANSVYTEHALERAESRPAACAIRSGGTRPATTAGTVSNSRAPSPSPASVSHHVPDNTDSAPHDACRDAIHTTPASTSRTQFGNLI